MAIVDSSRLSRTRNYRTTGVPGLVMRTEVVEGTYTRMPVLQGLVGRAWRKHWPKRKTLTSLRRLRTLWRLAVSLLNHLPRRRMDFRPPQRHPVISRIMTSQIWPTTLVATLLAVRRPSLPLTHPFMEGQIHDLLRLPM